MLSWEAIAQSVSLNTLLIGYCDISCSGIRVLCGLSKENSGDEIQLFSSSQVQDPVFSIGSTSLLTLEVIQGGIGLLKVNAEIEENCSTSLAAELADGVNILKPGKVLVVAAARLDDSLEDALYYTNPKALGWDGDEEEGAAAAARARALDPGAVAVRDPLLCALYRQLQLSAAAGAAGLLLWPGYRPRGWGTVGGRAGAKGAAPDEAGVDRAGAFLAQTLLGAAAAFNGGRSRPALARPPAAAGGAAAAMAAGRGGFLPTCL